jgi:universal stress protein E
MDSPRLEPHPLATLLVGTDLSDGALTGVQAGNVLARAAGARLHVLHASPEAEVGIDALNPTALLAHHVRHVVPPSDPVSLHLSPGVPFRSLTEAADELTADLIVLGGHRPRRIFDGLLGTTADRVIRTARQPVLAVNRSLSDPPHRILLATDFSPVADRALEITVDWAQRWGSPDVGAILEIVHVSAFAHPAYRPVLATEPLQACAAQAVARAQGRLRIRPRILSAPLAPEGILQAAEELRADLIVVGTHGHGGLVRTLIGSVASEVVRSLPYPILMVPPA